MVELGVGLPLGVVVVVVVSVGGYKIRLRLRRHNMVAALADIEMDFSEMEESLISQPPLVPGAPGTPSAGAVAMEPVKPETLGPIALAPESLTPIALDPAETPTPAGPGTTTTPTPRTRHQPSRAAKRK